MAVRADALEIARVLEEAARSKDLSRYKAPSPIGEDAAVYARLMKVLPRQGDVPGHLKEARFRPLYLVNGLVVAAALPRPSRAVLLEALAAGLLEFIEHFELLAERRAANPPPVTPEAAARQARYFAYVAAQLIECGLPVTGALAVMKADAADGDTSEEVRSWIERGPSAMLASPLLSERERELWKGVFDAGRAAWAPLRDHLVAVHGLPFRPVPER
ncbi:MAG: hypothetical protein SF051_13955 [Elusimicrobiota bacterium]|nr:hypothetical protein [Elusimicrobiota bacterium]